LDIPLLGAGLSQNSGGATHVSFHGPTLPHWLRIAFTALQIDEGLSRIYNWISGKALAALLQARGAVRCASASWLSIAITQGSPVGRAVLGSARVGTNTPQACQGDIQENDVKGTANATFSTIRPTSKSLLKKRPKGDYC
jgi:hypothetical protein